MLRRGYRRRIEDLVVFALIPFFLFTWVVQLAALPLRDSLYAATPLRLIVDFFGLTQGFAVFAPSVPKVNQQVRALITLEDGTLVLWDVPAIQRLSVFDRWGAEGFRKWSSDELLHPNSAAWLYPDACRYAASQCSVGGARPRTVQLICYSSPINPPATAALPNAAVAVTPLYYYVVAEGERF